MSSPPERIGPFVVEGVLGHGGAGIVYRGRDPTGAKVAIKRIPTGDEELAARLLREADVRVQHENVVRVIASGIDAHGEPYVVSELLEGETLRERFARGIAPPELVALAAQAARGLAALHEAGVVHRDLKPANLFVTREGVLKILDFGTAAFADARTVLTTTGALIGTPAYLSPEQARGDRRVDERADVWSLGMTLYEGLTGELPFHRSTLAATALAIQHDPLPSIFARVPELPLELGILVERCLARDLE
ncbi:MAG TPA: serine/threonine-protein kinase, partial [Sandaracinaceae bacterium]